MTLTGQPTIGHAMDSAQTWTLIGGFLGIFTIFAGLLMQSVKATIQASIAPIIERLAKLETKIEYLDRDVQGIAVRWGKGQEPTS